MGCVLLVSSCDPNGDFAQYCFVSGACTCNGSDCCSLTVCGMESASIAAMGQLASADTARSNKRALSFSPVQLDLGHFPGLQSGLTGSLTVTNPGHSAAASLQIVPQVAGDPTEFTVDASGCPTDLGPGQSCKVSIGVTPKTLGLKQATLTATADDVTPSATCPVTATFGQLIAIDWSCPPTGWRRYRP